MKRYDWRLNVEGEEEEYTTLTGRYLHAGEVLPQVENLERNIRILTDACKLWEQRFNNLAIIIRRIADEHMATGELSPEVIEIARTALGKWEPSGMQQALASEMGIDPSFSDMNPRISRVIEVDALIRTLREAKEFIENQQLPDAEWARVLDICVKALRQG